MALKDFLAVINHVDLARSNRFVVEIQPPTIPGLGIKPQQQINLMCQDVTFPGQNMRTATDDLRQGPTRDIAQAVTYGNTNMTFLCTPGLPEKLFFEAWQKLMFNSVTWQAKFYRDYIGQIKLRELDRTDMVRYGIILYEAYPKIINAQDYSNTAADAFQTLQVEFAFHHWKMDDEIYNTNEQFFGSRNEDENKPKRTTKAGYENMTYEQAQAFLRQNSIETLTADAGGTAAHANLLGGAQSIDMGAASTKMAGLFKGFNQAVGTLPLDNRKGTGVAVDAEKVPAQQKVADPVKTPNKSKGVYNYFDGAPKKGRSKTDPDTHDMTTEVTVFGDKTGKVAWASNPGNRKHAGAIVAAAEAKAQAAEHFRDNNTLSGGFAGGRAGAKKAERLRAEADALRIKYGMPAYQTEPTGDVVAAKVESKRAAIWINPNTGQSVGGSSKGNMGTMIKNGFAQMQKMWPGSYSGSVATTTTGVMRQSVSSRSVSAKVGGVSVRATISLGGGGGSGLGGLGGLGSLIAARGLASGIGIPRFGGIPAVRGAGFQVRSVGYRRPSSGGRANHNAEGGESGDGPGDR